MATEHIDPSELRNFYKRQLDERIGAIDSRIKDEDMDKVLEDYSSTLKPPTAAEVLIMAERTRLQGRATSAIGFRSTPRGGFDLRG